MRRDREPRAGKITSEPQVAENSPWQSQGTRFQDLFMLPYLG